MLKLLKRTILINYFYFKVELIWQLTLIKYLNHYGLGIFFDIAIIQRNIKFYKTLIILVRIIKITSLYNFILKALQ